MTTVKEGLKRQRRKGRIKRIGFSILGVAVIAVGVCGFKVYKENQFLKSVKLEEVKESVKTIKHSSSDIFTTKYQKEAQTQIDALKKKKNYTDKKPLIIANPYGTNTTSLYFYGKTKRASYVVCKVASKGAVTLENTLDNGTKEKYKTTHEYEIVGLVPGAENKVTLTFYNEKNKKVSEKHFDVTMPEDKSIPKILDEDKGTSKQKMSDGLFCMFGYDKGSDYNNYLFDNNGVCRGRMPLNSYRNDRFLFVKKQMIYSYENDKLAFVNRLGKVTRTISVDGYEFHHDMVYSKKYNKIVILVNDKKKDTIEDCVIVVDIKSGKIDKKIDFEDDMKVMKDNAVKPEKNAYGGTELDWIHINSLDFIDGDSMIFSSREQSALIKLDNIFGNEKIDYIIHSGSVYRGTEYEELLLEKDGEFEGNAGQHTITVERDNSLKEGQYYLYMFNNNYALSDTIPNFDWSLYPSAGTYEEGEASKYLKYLVDENEGTYKLEQSFDLPYSSIVSSVQQLDGNIPFSSGVCKTFGEYDEKGKLIKSFEYDAKKLAYRVMKYNFKGYWYR